MTKKPKPAVYEYRLSRDKMNADGVNYQERLDSAIGYDNWVVVLQQKPQIMIAIKGDDAAAKVWAFMSAYAHRPEYYGERPWRVRYGDWEFYVRHYPHKRKAKIESTESGSPRTRFAFMAHASYEGRDRLPNALKTALRPLVNGPMRFETSVALDDPAQWRQCDKLRKQHYEYSIWAVTSTDPQIKAKIDEAFSEVAYIFEQPLRHFEASA